ncbi:glycoside hydrolase family 28 protein [Halosimplex salinum]|uniref:glycoside hydrolase family 28 protein n=1 Tax=Halosimplex salinum TaxID=1710538 RepID=UPI000F467C5A|nr:glycosyl hydrolase family 28 protein [Halosimplex salinum]
MPETGATVTVTEYLDDEAPTDTAAVQAAIDATGDHGGGRVAVPPGEYETGTIRLRDDVTLHLEPGATVFASPDEADYADERVGPDGERPFLVAEGRRNVALTGRGTFHGRGTEIMRMDEPIEGHSGESSAHPLVTSGAHDARQGDDYLDRSRGTDDWPVAKPAFRPGPMFLFADCENVHVSDLTLRNMPSWTLHFEGTTGVDVRGVDILGNKYIPNNDGIAITDSRDVHVSDCTVVTCDDSIVLNGTSEIDQPCENVTVTNCTLESNACAIKFGSSTDGPMRNFCFQNVAIRDTNRGLGIQHRDSGTLENVLFSDVVVETRLLSGPWWGKAEPIYVTSLPRTDDTDLGSVRNVRFSNVVARGENGALVYGSDEASIEGVTFDDVRVEIDGSENSDRTGGNFDLQPTAAETPIVERDISGLHCEGVADLAVRDVRVDWADDVPTYYAHGLACEHASDVDVRGFDGRQAHRDGDAAAVALERVETVSVRDSRARPRTGQFLATDEVRDARLFAGNDLADAESAGDPDEAGFTTAGNVPPS